MQTASAPIKLLTLIIGMVSTALALAGVAAALFAIESPIWGMLSFEAVLLVASALAVLVGLGKFGAGFGLACATLGGTIIGAALLGSIDAKTNLSAGGSTLARFVVPVLGLRAGMGVLLACLGGVAVLSRRPTEWRRFWFGAALTTPVLLAGAALASGRLNGFLAAKEGTQETIRISVLLASGLLAIVLLSAGGHLLITAFERCRDEPDQG